MKKMSIMRASAFMCMAVFLLLASGCPNAAKNENHTPNPGPEPAPLPEIGDKIPLNVRVLSIETAVVGEKGGTESYKVVKDFNLKFSGPYEAETKTAYIALKIKAGEKPSGNDFKITVENMNTYEEKVKLKRGSGADDEYFVLAKKDKEIPMSDKIPLSKGKNTLAITVTSPDGSETGKYFVTLDYAGASDETGKKIIPGIYCPAQRKPLEGEKEDFVWAIIARGG